METARKITVAVPPELLERAQRASGSDITQTVRTGLPPVAASQTYARLRQLRGKVRFTRTLAELKADRRFAVDTSTALQDRQVLMAPLCSRTSGVSARTSTPTAEEFELIPHACDGHGCAKTQDAAQLLADREALSRRQNHTGMFSPGTDPLAVKPIEIADVERV